MKKLTKTLLLSITLLMASCGDVGYSDIKLGDSLATFKEKYKNHECFIGENYLCRVVVEDSNLDVYINKDEKIFKIQVYKLIENLTMLQMIEGMKEKYGEAKHISTEGKWAQWCLKNNCKVTVVAQYVMPPPFENEKGKDWVRVSDCVVYFPKNKKCKDGAPYLTVTYSDERISGVWIQKNDSQLKKF
jgi:hypothetical protein